MTARAVGVIVETMRKAIYPGSFDPVTNGHVDVISRSSLLFDHVTVSVVVNPQKRSLFTVEERLTMLKNAIKPFKNVSVDSFEGLLVDYLHKKKCFIIVKGLRAVTDFEYEFQMAHMNHKLYKHVETVFLIAASQHSFLSSSIVKEVAELGGKVNDLVPKGVEKKLKEKFRKE